MTDAPSPVAEPMRTLLVVGAAHVDRIGRSSVPFRMGASNPGVLRQSVGGASLNAAVALRSFGATVRLVSARGGDVGGLTVTAELAHHGIEDEAIVWLDRATASYTAILDENGELVAGIADMAIYDMLTPRVLARRHLRESLVAASVVLMDANLSAPTLAALCAGAAGLRAAIAVSPQKVVRLREVLPVLDLVFLSQAEARALADYEDALAGLPAALRERGVRRAVVTDGPRDILILDGQETFRQRPAEIAGVRDVTGAGDSLAAVTFLEYARKRPLKDAVRLGLAASTLRITEGFGPDAAVRATRIADTLPPSQPFLQDTQA